MPSQPRQQPGRSLELVYSGETKHMHGQTRSLSQEHPTVIVGKHYEPAMSEEQNLVIGHTYMNMCTFTWKDPTSVTVVTRARDLKVYKMGSELSGAPTDEDVFLQVPKSEAERVPGVILHKHKNRPGQYESTEVTLKLGQRIYFLDSNNHEHYLTLREENVEKKKQDPVFKRQLVREYLDLQAKAEQEQETIDALNRQLNELHREINRKDPHEQAVIKARQKIDKLEQEIEDTEQKGGDDVHAEKEANEGELLRLRELRMQLREELEREDLLIYQESHPSLLPREHGAVRSIKYAGRPAAANEAAAAPQMEDEIELRRNETYETLDDGDFGGADGPAAKRQRRASGSVSVDLSDFGGADEVVNQQDTKVMEDQEDDLLADSD